MIETVEKIKVTSGKLFDSMEEATKYEESYQRLQVALDGLGKGPEYNYPNSTCVQITKVGLDYAIKVFLEECQLWIPESTTKFNVSYVHLHETFIARVIDDSDGLPSNLNTLCYVLRCINTENLLRYDQIYSKNHPAGIKIEGE